MTRKRIAAILSVMAFLGAFAPAKADPIVDVFPGCQPYGRVPRFVDTRLNIIGAGYTVGGNCSQVLDTLRVCLDHNGVTVATTCRNYTSPSGGDSFKTRCLPGLWESMVIATYKDGTAEIAHSGDTQGLLLVTTECRVQ